MGERETRGCYWSQFLEISSPKLPISNASSRFNSYPQFINNFLNTLNLFPLIGFVKMSAVIIDDGVWTIWMSSLSFLSLRKKYLMSMWRDCWFVGLSFWIILIVLILSWWILIPLLWNCNSFKMFWTYFPCETISALATNSASVLDFVTSFCFVEDTYRGPFPIDITWPVWLFLVAVTP